MFEKDSCWTPSIASPLAWLKLLSLQSFELATFSSGIKMRPIGVISEAAIETLGDIWDPSGVVTKRVDLAAVDTRVLLTFKEQLDIKPSLVKQLSDGWVSFWSQGKIMCHIPWS